MTCVPAPWQSSLCAWYKDSVDFTLFLILSLTPNNLVPVKLFKDASQRLKSGIATDIEPITWLGFSHKLATISGLEEALGGANASGNWASL